MGIAQRLDRVYTPSVKGSLKNFAMKSIEEQEEMGKLERLQVEQPMRSCYRSSDGLGPKNCGGEEKCFLTGVLILTSLHLLVFFIDPVS